MLLLSEGELIVYVTFPQMNFTCAIYVNLCPKAEKALKWKPFFLDQIHLIC